MSLLQWHEEPIAKFHDRASFDCGEPALNEFLRRHARQSHQRGGAKTSLSLVLPLQTIRAALEASQEG